MKKSRKLAIFISKKEIEQMIVIYSNFTVVCKTALLSYNLFNSRLFNNYVNALMQLYAKLV